MQHVNHCAVRSSFVPLLRSDQSLSPQKNKTRHGGTKPKGLLKFLEQFENRACKTCKVPAFPGVSTLAFCRHPRRKGRLPDILGSRLLRLRSLETNASRLWAMKQCQTALPCIRTSITCFHHVVYIYIYIYICIYIHIHIYIHTYMHACIHTYNNYAYVCIYI